jgi:hypothetical protein
MSSDEAFGGYWDRGDSIDPDLVCYPIKKMIERDARRAGIDIDNPLHSVASMLGGGFMSAVLGSFMGPFGAILGGLFAHVAAMGTPMIGDRQGGYDAEEEAWYALKLKAVGVAVEVTKEHTTRDTWNRISDEVQETIQRVIRSHDDPGSLRAAWPIMFDAITDSIREVDYDVYRNFMDVYETASSELGV